MVLQGFREFLLEGNILDNTVGYIMGIAFEELVSSFVANMLTPSIAALGGQQDFSSLTFKVNGSNFKYGTFINSVISFLLLALSVYYGILTPMQRLQVALGAQKKQTQKECPFCRSEVPAEASRCRYCTSMLLPFEMDEADEVEAENRGGGLQFLGAGARMGLQFGRKLLGKSKGASTKDKEEAEAEKLTEKDASELEEFRELNPRARALSASGNRPRADPSTSNAGEVKVEVYED